MVERLNIVVFTDFTKEGGGEREGEGGRGGGGEGGERWREVGTREGVGKGVCLSFLHSCCALLPGSHGCHVTSPGHMTQRWSHACCLTHVVSRMLSLTAGTSSACLDLLTSCFSHTLHSSHFLFEKEPNT